MRRIFALGLFAMLLAGCDSSYDPPVSYPSPNGKYVVDVVKELQGANDSQPWWYHITLRSLGAPPGTEKGNFLNYSNNSNTPPVIVWKDDAHLEIVLKDMAYTFEKIKIPRELEMINVRVIVERPVPKENR